MTIIKLFTMQGCAPCAVIKPKLQSLANGAGITLEIIDVLTTEGKKEMTQMGVFTLPHVFVQRGTEGAVSFPPTAQGQYEAIEKYATTGDTEGGNNTILYVGVGALLITLTFFYTRRKKSM